MEPRHPSRLSRRSLHRVLGTFALAALVTAPLAGAGPSRSVGLLSSGERLELATSDGTRVDIAGAMGEGHGVLFARAEALDDGWIVAGVRGDEALLLLRAHDASGAEPERVVVPAAGGTLVASPAPIVSDGRLLGMVWLAGEAPRSLGVRYAEWLGDRWGESETVAAPGPGSQLAATGVALDDGSVLVVWSAFDGEDDEILWSLRSEGEWSRAARIAEDNAVPDITPAVALDGDHPVAVWSRFDGRSYSLMGSRLTADGWSRPTPLAPTGSLFPRLVDSPEGMMVLYRDVPAGGWTVVRLDGELRQVARASIAPGGETGETGETGPWIVAADRETVELIPGPGKDPVTLRWNR